MSELQGDQGHRRLPIPDPIKRSVRQRCGFGCIFCGHPLYEYHHMIPYARIREHTEANLTLLCDSHHREATNGFIPAEQVAARNSNPHNVQNGISTPFALHFGGSEFQVEIGSNQLSGGLPHPAGGIAFIPVSIDDIDLIWFRIEEGGRIFLYLNIFDECNLPLLAISENELRFKTDTWDIEFVGRTLTLRQAPREIFLEIEFRPPNGIAIRRGRLLCNGVEIMIHDDRIFIVNAGQTFSNCGIQGGAIGLQLGRNDRGYPVCLRSAPQLLKRYGIDREQLIRQNAENAARIRAQLPVRG